ncbi:MAG TPA: hypothetical protein VE441_00090 [Mycobacterium sp.]|nr:hypothetical protein [Mycobacterium sp.]
MTGLADGVIPRHSGQHSVSSAPLGDADSRRDWTDPRPSATLIDLFPKTPVPYVWERYERAIEEIERQRVFTRRSITLVIRDYSATNRAVDVLRIAGLIKQISPARRRPQVFRTVS